MLFPVWATQGCLQPFRFTEMAEDVRQKLGSQVEHMLSGTMRIEPDPAAQNAGEPQFSESPDRASETPPTQVSLYFDSPADALRFTVAISSVISAESRDSVREDFFKLARAIANVSRVTTKGVVHGNGHHADPRATKSLTAAS